MPRGRSKKSVIERRARALALTRLYLVAAALVVVALLIALELSQSGAWTSLRADLFGPRDLTESAEALNDAIDARLIRLGILDVSSASEEEEDETGAWVSWEKRGRIPHGLGIFYCNAGITEAVRSSGGHVIRVTESGPDWRGSLTLDMRLGVGGVETHHIILRESHEPPDRETGRDGGIRIAILIDDLGYNRGEVVEGLLSLDFPVSVSILPGTPYCEVLAREAREAGVEVLAHLPMEPADYPEVDPGEGALLLEHSHWENRERVDAALDQVPGAVGANNHMGSSFCRDRARMSTVAAAVSARGMFYVDSMTTPASEGYAAARNAGVPTVRNNMFIDSLLDEEGRVDVHSQLAALEEIARKRGFGVGIGHPHPETLEALRSEIPEMQARGIEFVLVSELAE
ncbi:MAG: hypothetical protein GF400_03885 [Candidatus Eisenbacteria bacterium]|nr:hypothetical protein [Candidatus Eisenbacteria bacterium]